jgi:hypothetical protein
MLRLAIVSADILSAWALLSDCRLWLMIDAESLAVLSFSEAELVSG